MFKHTMLLLGFLAAATLWADDDQPRESAETARVVEVDREVIVLEEAPPSEDASEEEKADYWERVRRQYEVAKAKSMELVEKTKDTTGDYYDRTKDAAGDAYRKAREATGDAYDKAKDATTGWYDDARDWTEEDLKKAGSWHYRVVVIDKVDLIRHPERVQEQLGELGAERFECFWVEPLDESHTRLAFFFKKSGFSYLKSIPAQQFWRFLPSGDGDQGEK